MAAVARPSPPDNHPVNQDWVGGKAVSYWHDVAAINEALAALENLVRMAEFDGDTQWASELRQVAGLCRERRDGRKSRATELELADK